MKQPSRGLSLLEMLVTLAVIAVLAVATTSLCRHLLLEARMVAAVNGFVHAIQLARATAVVEARDVVVCRSSDAAHCAAAGDWSSGWIVFVNRDRDDPAVVDRGEPLLVAVPAVPLTSIRSNRRAYALHPFAVRGTNGTAVFCDARGAAAARAVIISYTGRPRLARTAADGSALTCPA